MQTLTDRIKQAKQSQEIKMIGGRWHGYDAVFTPAEVLLDWFSKMNPTKLHEYPIENMQSIRLWQYISFYHEQIFLEWQRDRKTKVAFQMMKLPGRITKPVTMFEKLADRISKVFS